MRLFAQEVRCYVSGSHLLRPSQWMPPFESCLRSFLAANHGEYFPETIAENLHYPGNFCATSSTQHVESIHEISKDYLRIPTCNTTADSVLAWPIFEGRFPPEYLIDILLESPSH